MASKEEVDLFEAAKLALLRKIPNAGSAGAARELAEAYAALSGVRVRETGVRGDGAIA